MSATTPVEEVPTGNTFDNIAGVSQLLPVGACP